MIRVLIVDDQALVRSGLRLILEAQADLVVVGEAEDAAAALTAARALLPDVVLMDVRMPGADGIEATRRLNELGLDPTPRVIVLTTFDLDRHVYDALRAGACGFLTKDVARGQLIDAVRVAAAGGTLLAPTVTRRLIEHFTSGPPPGPGRPAALETLTDREVDVLRSVAGGGSNADVARALFLSEATVKTHLNRLLTKLGLGNRTQAVVLAYEVGLVQPGRGDASTGT
ncbi:response regulator transcription factor [Georgenia yuyongxinii]|uniref:Response regulator transcription factor n=1 Tax=Georgenia yuyongxinii TaxID=2589797 RepID=A0A5B8C2D0_9MICO|nr:response regulator transcription factor [Georgenia yuyongxinii]QDC24694.1 response regulator transcription factor [Georgenia yuyongxinii]